jgi:hypothetical protein
MVSDEARRDLYEVLEKRLGAGAAGTLMELLPPVGWADVARTSDLVAVRGEMAGLRGEMAELRGEMGSLRGEIKSEIASLRNQLFVANVATTCAVAGLVLAAAKLT